jgi:hypothetical protein
MSDNARTRLAALREKKPAAKAAQIRRLWPEIKAALDNGHSLKAVSECLAADGITVTVRSLSSYIARIRKSSFAVQSPPAPRRAGSLVSGSNAKVATVGPETRGSQDPLANVRERQTKRPGFDYRPELADPKELI